MAHDRNGTPATDHEGRPWPSESAMCRGWNVPLSTYKGRMARGWTKAQALSVPTDGQGPKIIPRKETIKDHLGQEFVSVGAMCRHWDIDEKVYWSRKRLLEWPLDKILTTPVRNDAANAVKISDHEGREFPSISAMCRHWGIGLSTYRERRKRGWDVGRALTGQEAEIKTQPVPCKDHLGNGYPSKNAMCAAWGVTRYCYDSRIALGWSRADALARPMSVNARPCRDHMGREFPAAVYMALYLGFPKYAFHGRSGDLAGLIPSFAADYWRGRKCGRYFIQGCIEFPWFLAKDGRSPFVLDFESLLDEWHRTDFRPLPETAAKNQAVRAVRLVEWPWYLCEIDGRQAVMPYLDLVTAHKDSNYGLARPKEKRDRRNGT